MNLRERLEKLRQARGHSPVGEAEASTPSVAERHACAGGGAHAGSDERIAEMLGGKAVAEGLVLVERHLPLSHRHGQLALGEILAAPLAKLDPAAESAEGLLFFDTETTGLAGGTGTLPFLLGLARIEGERLSLAQFFLTRFKGEAALLDAARAWCTEARTLVSFNGKSFDAPLLSARFRLHRRPDPLARLRHLDLLPPTRAAFAQRWPDCRLKTAEQALLGFARAGDLPSHLVPQVWFDFVRAGNTARLPDILAHNRWDLVSLVALAARLARLYARADHPEADVVGIARRLLRRGEASSAHAQLERAQDHLDRRGLLVLAKLARRQGDWARAVGLWQQAAAQDCPEALLCLAKYYEHVARDRTAALACAERLAGLRPGPDLARRLARLRGFKPR